MSKVLKVECIADHADHLMKVHRNLANSLIPGLGDYTFGKMPRGYWVAEIIGRHPKFRFQREFLRFKKDYSEANSIGSRGVYAYYILEDNKVYEVCSPISWKNTDRYFCTVVGGEIIRLTKEEVDEWLNDTLTQMSSQPQSNV